VPYYWKRGLLFGVIIGVILHLLLGHLAARDEGLSSSNLPTASTTRPEPKPGTPLGPLIGVTVFLLCCVMPGPQAGRVGQ
jgi:hypothetical protein